MTPTLRYARASDGVTIAYTMTGEGPPLVWMPSVPFSSVIAEWRVPNWGRGFELLSEHLRLIIYDGRGTGNSQRGVTDLGLEAMLRDLDAVVAATGIESFALLGYYGSVPHAIAYAARHPDRVTALVLFGGALRTEDTFSPRQNKALMSLVDRDWDVFVDAAVNAWMGWSVGENGRLIADAFRTATTPEEAKATLDGLRGIDVSDQVGKVTAPALVLHRDREPMPFERSQALAQALPNGRLLHLDGEAAALLLEQTDADVAVLLDFLLGRAPTPDAGTPAAGKRVDAPATPEDAVDPPPQGVFISVAELHKDVLARPFKALLEQHGLKGYIVSDEPRPEGVWTPEEKVDAYLDRSDAAVVFATADVAAGDDRYTRPNIGDEIGRARSKPRLRDRVCVLKEHGVILPSNIDPAYESLDPNHPDEAFQRALAQLAAWGFPVGATVAPG